MKTCLTIFICSVCCYATMMGNDSLVADSTVLSATSTLEDSLSPQTAADSMPLPSSGPLSTTDTTIKKSGANQPQTVRKIKLIKRKYNYRQQVLLAVGMMAFVALAMMSAQTWNPK